MTFTVRKLSHRPWPVSVTLLSSDDDGSVHEEINTFVAHFRPFTEDELADLRKEVNAANPAAGSLEVPDATVEENTPIPVILRRNADFFSSLIVGWGPEVRDEKHQSVPFSKEALCGLVTGPDGMAVSVGINQALQQIRYGVAPAKNALTSPAPGQPAGSGEAAPTN